MALRAEPRVGDFQQPVVDRAVGLMAVGAVFKRGRMFPQERTAPLGVAGVTVLVDASLFELGGIRRSVRVVAVAAADFSFAQRHMRRAHELRLSLQMALPADLDVRALPEKWGFVVDLRELIAIRRLMHDRMAVRA